MDTNIIANTPPPPAPLSPAQVIEFLDYSFESLLARRDELVPALLAMANAHPLIAEDDEATAGVFVENIAMAKAFLAAVKRAHDEAKRPYIDGGKAVGGWQDRTTAPITAVLARLNTTLLGYVTRKEAKAREEARRLAAEADAIARKAAAEASRAIKRNSPNYLDKLNEAARLSDAAVDAAAAAQDPKAAELSRTSGMFGAKAHVRTTWSYEVVDIDQVPLEFLTVNDDAVKGAMKDRDRRTGRPVRDIPGIRWLEQRSLGVR